MSDRAGQSHRRFRAYTNRDLDKIPQLSRLSADHRRSLKAVAAVLPFRVNNYVLDELIDWDRVPDDPMFQLTIPQPGMLAPDELARMRALVEAGERAAIVAAARELQRQLNPHPAGQLKLNVPSLDGARVKGVQHKYRETALFFPTPGQTCHSYCTYCFRWAQFVGVDELKFAAREADTLVRYLQRHPEVTDVLFTGGDPMVMRTRVLRRYVEPLLDAELPGLTSIRFGTKAPAYWPQRFTTDDDADDLMRLLELVQRRGKHVSVMAHFSHPRELEPAIARSAIRRLQGAGALVRRQAPLIRRVNDDAETWSRMWHTQVSLGAVPYYMFIARDTGPKEYFKVPLHRAYRIFRDAHASLSGLARTARGPSMSTTPGKIVIDGAAELAGEPVFALRFLQARRAAWTGRPFYAKLDERAAWFDELRPAFGEPAFFFEAELASMQRSA